MSSTTTLPPEARGDSGAARTPRRRRWLLGAFALALVWLAVGGVAGPYAGKLSEVQTNDNASFLPASAESTRVAELQRGFADADVLPAILIYERSSGLTEADQLAINADLDRVAELTTLPRQQLAAVPSQDGKAVQVFVPLPAPTAGGDGFGTDTVLGIKDLLAAGKPAGLDAYLGGPAAQIADFGDAFAGIDGILLLVTVSVVLVILLAVYRSPILPFVVLFGGVLALGAASFVTYLLADHQVLTLNGQSQGILFILVLGATTDYSLLLVSRYREELRRQADRVTAIRIAWRRSVEPILASGGTVVLALLCLLFSDSNANRSLGPVGAIGIAASMLVALTGLPAVLALVGRVGFWPFMPKYSTDSAPDRGLWAGISGLVGRYPRWTWVASGLVLLAMAAFVPTLRSQGIPQSEVFLNTPPSVVAQNALARHFPAGSSGPATVIADTGSLDEVVRVAQGTDGVESVTTTTSAAQGAPAPGGSAAPKVVDGKVEVSVVLSDAPDSDAAIDTVRRLRTGVHAVEGANALVGGLTATDLDSRDTSFRDRKLIIPIVLAVIFVVLALLLRALVAPLLLLVTVVLSFAATLGVSAIVFNHVFDFPGSDPSTPLLGFIFLVALGIDYNIFLMTRVREETAAHGTREGTLLGLRVTGGVITSAGIVLAATFSALAVLPLVFLAQIAFIVAFGVLLDTVVVRSLLVPAAAVEIGRRIWWPSKLDRAVR
jgi:RND superfamily putative drug exporter